MTASVELVFSHENPAVIEDLIRDVNMLAHAWGVEVERTPQDNTIRRVLEPLLSTFVHDAECCVECEENNRVS